MTREEAYDSFYRATRRSVLHQAFALTGDLPAAQSAVRDAYVGAWQHWRKVSRLSDPLDWVRPRAWQLAQRRHTARIWHRNKGLADHHEAVLDALSHLPVAQRRVLLLVEVAGLAVPAAARELGITRDVADQNLRSGRDAFAAALGIGAAQVHERLLTLDDLLDAASLPRGPIVRRAGRKRRQGHALVGAVAALVVALSSGAVAYQADPSAATGARLLTPSAPAARDAGDLAPTAANLLDRDQIRRLGQTQSWKVTSTGDNTSGEGINTVCQRSRFADPDGLSALVRRYSAGGSPRRSAVQTVEVSKTEAQAREGFRTTVGWYAGCRLGRLQLLHSYRVENIGDEADVLMVRLWKKPVTTLSVAVARTGRVTTSTVGTTVGGTPPPAREITQSLADAVAMLCARSGAQDCAKRPAYRIVPPPPSGEERGILAVADLPPVGEITQPWVGTAPADARRTNPSATSCDRAGFAAAGARRTRTRTYLIPQADVPARFGLSETYGVFGSDHAAAEFLATVRKRVDGCEHRDLATTVGPEHRLTRGSPAIDLSSWDLETEVSQDRKVGFRVGFVRVGHTVAQVTFTPAPDDDITEQGFHDLVVRAGDRLRELS